MNQNYFPPDPDDDEEEFEDESEEMSEFYPFSSLEEMMQSLK